MNHLLKSLIPFLYFFLLNPFRLSKLYLLKRLLSLSRFLFNGLVYFFTRFTRRDITRIAGIEPTLMILKTTVLPLNYTPIFFDFANLELKGLLPASVELSRVH